MEEALPGIMTHVIGKLFVGGPADAVIAILLLVAIILFVLLLRANKAREAALERLDELQRYAMDKINQNNKDLAALLMQVSDKHANSQEKVAVALSSVNDSVRAVVFDLESRIRAGNPSH